jgi:DNA-3-methyladenine glycosylase II
MDWKPALAHLAKADPRLAPLIERHGAPTITPSKDHLQSLAKAIVSQQLSTAAANTIWNRVLALYPKGKFPKPEVILATPDEALRKAGLSGAKTAAVKDLARHAAEKRVVQSKLVKATDTEVLDTLIAVRGIGPWSVDMFLMFALARPDILPVGDLGIRKGMQLHFRLRKLPEAKRMEQLAAPWRPFRSVASWYMWRLLEPS